MRICASPFLLTSSRHTTSPELRGPMLIAGSASAAPSSPLGRSTTRDQDSCMASAWRGHSAANAAANETWQRLKHRDDEERRRQETQICSAPQVVGKTEFVRILRRMRSMRRGTTAGVVRGWMPVMLPSARPAGQARHWSSKCTCGEWQTHSSLSAISMHRLYVQTCRARRGRLSAIWQQCQRQGICRRYLPGS